MFKLVLEKAEETRSNCQHPLDHQKSKTVPQNIYFCFIDYTKAYDCVDHNKLENSERDGNTRPPNLPLKNLYAGQEATVRTGHGTTDWFKTGKGVQQDCILSPYLFNLYAKYIMLCQAG